VFEFDGTQHFSHRGGNWNTTLEERQQWDYEKTERALQHGYKIIRMHYSWLQLRKETQTAWLRAAIESPHMFVVTKCHYYYWMADLNPNEIVTAYSR
jgi:hypothetical protein